MCSHKYVSRIIIIIYYIDIINGKYLLPLYGKRTECEASIFYHTSVGVMSVHNIYIYSL